ncbi:MAG: hypothetical protein EXX96DRAFT_553614, partial [Benjaminiella poitrasii]
MLVFRLGALDLKTCTCSESLVIVYILSMIVSFLTEYDLIHLKYQVDFYQFFSINNLFDCTYFYAMLHNRTTRKCR